MTTMEAPGFSFLSVLAISTFFVGGMVGPLSLALESSTNLEALTCYDRSETLRAVGRDPSESFARREAERNLHYHINSERYDCEMDDGRFSEGFIYSRCRPFLSQYECESNVRVSCDCP